MLTMKQNQKYFPLLDGRESCCNRFLIVSATCTSTTRRNIVAGNERVVRARLADARFFYEQDRKQQARSRWCRSSARGLSQQARQPVRSASSGWSGWRRSSPGAARGRRPGGRARAGWPRPICVTDMVGEFPELQGIMGQYYARHDGETRRGRAAPSSSTTGRVSPATRCPQGIVRRGRRWPTSSIRWSASSASARCRPATRIRSACAAPRLGVLRILSSIALPLDLGELLRDRAGRLSGGGARCRHASTLHDFMLERLRGYLRDAGYAARRGRRGAGPAADAHRSRRAAARGGTGVPRTAGSGGAGGGQQAHRRIS